MEFSTDDNSYRSAQTAADFTSLLQIEMAEEPGVEWIERAQLCLAKQEFQLAAMQLLGGASPIRCGRLLRADWLVTGRFSLNDRNQFVLFLEVTDLHHADVLATRTVVFPDEAGSLTQVAEGQVELVAAALGEVLAEARVRQKEIENQILVAPLFLADVDPFGWVRGTDVLPREFHGSLERAFATDQGIRLIRFPKAYQAMDEAEMVLDGFTEEDRNSWRQTADLYVWGTYSVTNARTAGKVEPKLILTLQIWNGASQPEVIKEELVVSSGRELSTAEASAVLDRLTLAITARARKQTASGDSASIRKKIASSLVETVLRIRGPHGHIGIHDDAKFIQVVQMLETACFFDPDNADAHVLRITSRWGWRMDFGVKNEFWSKWRRSQAWGRYVDRFGLRPVTVRLPFPYERSGIPGIYVESAAEVVGMCPRYLPSELEESKSYAYIPLREAERRGFPKDIPNEAIQAWKAELETELANRKGRVEQFTGTSATNRISNAVLSNAGQYTAPQTRPSSAAAAPQTAPQPTKTPLPAARSLARVPTPDWLRTSTPTFSMFHLSAPGPRVVEVKPDLHEVPFPGQFEVRGVVQLAFLQDKLLILARDERSAQSSAPNPGLEADMLGRRARLWCIESSERSPVLFAENELPKSVSSFLVVGDQLWVTGESTGYLDLKNRAFRAFGFADGLNVKETHAATFAEDRVFIAGSRFSLHEFDPFGARWKEAPSPGGNLSTGTGIPLCLVAKGPWLGYVAGSALLYHVPTASWMNLPSLPDRMSVHCMIADGSGFWFGGRSSLNFYHLDERSLQNWPAPVGISGTRNHGMSLPFSTGTITEDALSQIDESIQKALKNVQKERAQYRAESRKKGGSIDPLQLNSRVPHEITALADDGDFLWVGTHSGLLLLHKPSLSVIGHCKLEGQVSSLAITETDLWVGAAYGRQVLVRIPKHFFQAIPRNQWLSLAISAADRQQLVRSMSARDQAMYAFYAGDDARVAELLGNVNPAAASLEEMFLLAFACDVSGLDKPDLSRGWFQQIINRYPDSPWAKTAQEAINENDQNHKLKRRAASLLARYDRNRDGVIDGEEKGAMEKDPAYQRETNAFENDQLYEQLKEVMKRFDRTGDGKLDLDEVEYLRSQMILFAEAPPQMLVGRKIVVAPLMTRNPPSAKAILKSYDANKDGGLDVDELNEVARKIRK